MSRGWVLMDETQEISEEDYNVLCVKADILAEEWSRLHDEDEQESFLLRADDDGGWINPDYDQDDMLVMIADEQRRRMASEARRAQAQAIDRQLAELGVRMMRPYEHWNEDEALMEYLERDRY